MHSCTRLIRKHIKASMNLMPMPLNNVASSTKRWSHAHVITAVKDMTDLFLRPSLRGSTQVTFPLFNINDAQFGVNNFNAFPHYQLWLGHSRILSWHPFHRQSFDTLTFFDSPECWTMKECVMNEVVTCVLVLIKIDVAFVNFMEITKG